MTTHYLTIDVEEHFQVSAFEEFVSRSDWDRLESRVDGNVHRLLELLAEHQARATFFVLGWLAERHPGLVRDIAGAGHEIASHGWDHRRVTGQEPAHFRVSVSRSKRLLEDLTGAPVLGFRAPSFSIVRGLEWALDILVEEGYQYDSSLFPVIRPGYGYANGLREPHRLDRPHGRLVELPPATRRLMGQNLPAAGGGYLRIFPYWLVHGAIAEFDRRGVPATLYLHPWEIDPEQPRFPVPLLARLRHYTGLRRTLPRLSRLLAEFKFTAICDGLASVI